MFFKYKKFVLIFSLLVILMPQTSFALDARCWTQATCVDGGGTFYGPTDETRGVCGGETTSGLSGASEHVGFCMPVGHAVTGVNFAGKKDFSNFGEFIKWMYQYGIQVAAVLAVVMIIVAGIQWATSAGSSERAGAARKRIGGALMGLFLALLSYLVLNLINPYMVNLRLPQVWMINTLGLAPVYCDMVEGGKMVSENKGGPFTKDPKSTECGKEFYVQGTNDATCKGRYCDGSVCMKSGGVDSSGKQTEMCYVGALGGSIGAEQSMFGLCSDLEGNIIDDDLTLIAVCSNGDIEGINTLQLDKSTGKNARWYIFGQGIAGKNAIGNLIQKYEDKCMNNGGKLVGFYLGADINDEGTSLAGLPGLVGLPSCSGAKVSSGCDDWHAIGRGSDNKCNVNLAKLGYSILNGGAKPACDTKENLWACSCAGVSSDSLLAKMVLSEDFTKHLIKKEELLNGFACDIFIDRDEFPALDNKGGWVECSSINPFDDPTYCWRYQSVFYDATK